MLLEDLFAGTSVDVPQMLNHLEEVAASLNLPFTTRLKTYNSRLAQEVGLWAESLGKGHAFHMAAFHAYFAEGCNLADHHILVDIAGKAGLDGDATREVIKTRSFSPHVDEHWRVSRQKGVTAVPTFIINDRSLTGARPFNDLLHLVRQAENSER